MKRDKNLGIKQVNHISAYGMSITMVLDESVCFVIGGRTFGNFLISTQMPILLNGKIHMKESPIMNEKKYYHISYTINGSPSNCVADKHPYGVVIYEWLSLFKKLRGLRVIVGWKEIDKEEFDLGLKVIGRG